MRLTLKRIYTCKDYTIGHLYVNDTYICDTLEDADRGLHSMMPLSKIEQIKVKDKTCIPYGEYKILLTYSPKFGKRSWALKYGGEVPLIENVPCWSGVRIHPANLATELSGCIAPGYNKIKGKVIDSIKCYNMLMDKYIMPALKRREKIIISINSTYNN